MLTAFAVFDSKSAAFGNPMFLANEAVAIRGFTDACNAKDSNLNLHPEDYALHKIGTYEANSGKLTDISPAVHIISASSVLVLAVPLDVKSTKPLLVSMNAGASK